MEAEGNQKCIDRINCWLDTRDIAFQCANLRFLQVLCGLLYLNLGLQIGNCLFELGLPGFVQRHGSLQRLFEKELPDLFLERLSLLC